VAWARLLLPEPRMPASWRDSHSAMLLLHIDRRPWDVDGPSAYPTPFLEWHNSFRKVLECPAVLAGFLTQDIGLDIPEKDPMASEEFYGLNLGPSNHIASVGVSLNTPHAMTDLVNISGYQQLPGSPVSSQFDAYAVTHDQGLEAADMAIDWMRQMCDDVLHLDEYDSSLAILAMSGQDRRTGRI
jgi:hypothetical protein